MGRLPSLSAAPQRHPDCCLSLSTALLSRIAAACVEQGATNAGGGAAAAATDNDVALVAASAGEGCRCGEDRDQTRLRKERVVLSIGSGSGLLEACLQRHIDGGDRDNDGSDDDNHDGGNRSAGIGRLVVRGVEVHQQISSDSSAGSRQQQKQKQQQVALNRYLPEHRRSTVMGTWEVFPELPALLRGTTGHGRTIQRRRRRRGGPDSGPDGGGRSDDGDEEEEQLARGIERGHDVSGEDSDGNNNHDYAPSFGDAAAGEDSGEEEVAALMFVYPRHPSLVRQYVDAVLASLDGRSSSSSNLQDDNGFRPKATAMIWLGPRADWVDFEPCFVDDGGDVDTHDTKNDHEGTVHESGRGAGDNKRSRIHVTVLEGGKAGLLDYEMMSVAYVS